MTTMTGTSIGGSLASAPTSKAANNDEYDQLLRSAIGNAASPASSSGTRLRNLSSSGDSELDGLTSARRDLEERERAKQKWVGALNYVWDKIHAACWVGFTCCLIYWTNFFRVIWESPLVNRSYLYAGFGCLAFNMSLLFYLALVCDYWLQLPKGEIEKRVPFATPAMLVAGGGTFCFFLVALYPAFGFLLTVGIQFTFFMGFLNSGHFLPSGVLGSILMFVIFFGAFFTSIVIPHEGLAHRKINVALANAEGR
ncbi:unnamed protein product [Amoebophrya sp. A25]|nr:unnamed protein product [Amoebophrya sp. A25]|eukprot:GSA25T00013836001.1